MFSRRMESVTCNFIDISNPIINPKDTIVSYEDENKLNKRNGLSLIVVFNDIFIEGINLVIGTSCEGHYALLPTIKFRSLGTKLKKFFIKVELWHEIGHLLRALPPDIPNLIKELGPHNAKYEICVMRQGF